MSWMVSGRTPFACASVSISSRWAVVRLVVGGLVQLELAVLLGQQRLVFGGQVHQVLPGGKADGTGLVVFVYRGRQGLISLLAGGEGAVGVVQLVGQGLGLLGGFGGGGRRPCPKPPRSRRWEDAAWLALRWARWFAMASQSTSRSASAWAAGRRPGCGAGPFAAARRPGCCRCGPGRPAIPGHSVRRSDWCRW